MNLSMLVSRYGTALSIFAVVLSAGLQLSGYMIPDWVYGVEGSFGLTAFRTTVSLAGAGPGWKSYTAAAITLIIAGLQAYGVPVPDQVYGIVAAFGLGSIHVAVNKI